MRSSLLTSSIMAVLATQNFPVEFIDDPDRFNCNALTPVDTPAEAERVTRELTDLDLERINKAEDKRARKREKYRA